MIEHHGFGHYGIMGFSLYALSPTRNPTNGDRWA